MYEVDRKILTALNRVDWAREKMIQAQNNLAILVTGADDYTRNTFGGWVVTLFTWRAIFLTPFVYAVAMLVLCVSSLPETLPRNARPPFGLRILAQQYVVAFGNRRFFLVALSLALSFAGLFLYVASAPALLGNELGLPPTQYAVMFVPIVAGIVLGSLGAERLAGRFASARLILAGFSVQLVTGIVNVIFHAVHAAIVPWSVLPLGC